ncbi:biotin/lipoyl-containing protein [Clostridium sp. ATCC 25772]|uniref:biotin/lipoyl-containing protein n=1 Tax=Clostridium sp. ATCC 25772 TaxID=1676991 RepID=UPI0007820C4C|nr:biotin/lipoyl-containing protein [Clostridium sp. ATCC 25772]
MKRYNVTVNGNVYQVEVEEVKGEFTSAPQPTNTVVKTAPKVKETPVVENKSAAQGEKLESPMPGTIVKINAVEGAKVKKGDVLFVLEAMKMENEIMAPVDGTVAKVSVPKGAAVNTGDILAVIG